MGLVFGGFIPFLYLVFSILNPINRGTPQNASNLYGFFKPPPLFFGKKKGHGEDDWPFFFFGF